MELFAVQSEGMVSRETTVLRHMGYHGGSQPSRAGEFLVQVGWEIERSWE